MSEKPPPLRLARWWEYVTGIENDAIRKDFSALYAAMDGKSLLEIDKIIDPVCTLCRDYQKTGFQEEGKVGIRLAQELGVDELKREQ